MPSSTPTAPPVYWPEQLDRGLVGVGMVLDQGQRALLLGYLGLLLKWNRVYNLSAVRNPDQMVGRHLLDSLAVAPFLQGERVLDLGTGAGLPGVPLAIAEPKRDFTLIDSNGKKTRFVQQAVIELRLSNVEVVRARVQAFHPAVTFDTVTARAFASLAQLWQLARPLLRAGGRLLAMKAAPPEQELADLGLPARIIPLEVPGLDGERCLIEVNG
jgi:16S rRNA (guanine527-N7)-methyltransferase